MSVIRVRIDHPDAKLPFKKYGLDAGYDLFSPVDVTLPPQSIAKIDTGIALDMDEVCGYYAQIHSRSGLASKGIMAVGGVIDVTYRGNICVLLYNSRYDDYVIKKGDRIAQMIFHTIINSISFEIADQLSVTDRGADGFGSTGN